VGHPEKLKVRLFAPILCLELILCLGVGAPAHAELGGKGAGVPAESTQLKARLQARSGSGLPSGAHTVYEMTLSDGTRVRQFAKSDGTVFAVSWDGQARPDLKTLFGDYFERFQADNAVKTPQTRRRALSSTHSDFVVRTFGGNGEVSGFAVLPKQAPSGFDVRALQVEP
jgi:hypothetical protein